jgi:hypothetical protein
MLTRKRSSSVLRRRKRRSMLRRRRSSMVRRRRLRLIVCRGRLKGATQLLLLLGPHGKMIGF